MLVACSIAAGKSESADRKVPASVMIAAFVLCADDAMCDARLERFTIRGIRVLSLTVRGEYGEKLRCVLLDDKSRRVLTERTFGVARREPKSDDERKTRYVVLMDFDREGTHDGILIPETTVIIRPSHAEWARHASARLRAFHAAIEDAWEHHIPQKYKELAQSSASR